MQIEPLQPGNYYHIYNRGNNGSRIFFEDDNYRHFLRLYENYMQPVANTFAWCLMSNHFHVLLYIKMDSEINKEDYLFSPGKEPKKPDASRQLGHLFNAYAQAVNKKYNRTGSLMEKPYHRKRITSDNYLRRLILYIHNNPVHHKITSTIESYPWTSYPDFCGEEKISLAKEEVMELFNDLENFKYCHQHITNSEPFQGLEP